MCVCVMWLADIHKIKHGGKAGGSPKCLYLCLLRVLSKGPSGRKLQTDQEETRDPVDEEKPQSIFNANTKCQSLAFDKEIST